MSRDDSSAGVWLIALGLWAIFGAMMYRGCVTHNEKKPALPQAVEQTEDKSDR